MGSATRLAGRLQPAELPLPHASLAVGRVSKTGGRERQRKKNQNWEARSCSTLDQGAYPGAGSWESAQTNQPARSWATHKQDRCDSATELLQCQRQSE